MTIIEDVKKLKESSKKRNFTQRFDLVITLKDMDLNKSENKLDELLPLPKIPGKPASITLFSDSVKSLDDVTVIKGSDIEKLGKDKKKLKNVIKETSIFLSEPKLMPVVGKHLGKYLAPVGKMPKPIVGDIKEVVKDYESGVQIRTTKQPMLQMPVGSEDMDDKDITDNVSSVLNFLKSKLPKGKNNISKVYLKLTMSKPIKLEGW